MYRYLITALLIMFAAAVSAQESESTDDADAPPGESQAAAEEDDADLDDENYQDAEEEDFVPTEDIPTDQAIPFPTDI